MTLAGGRQAIFVDAIGPTSRLDPSVVYVAVNRLQPVNPDIDPSSPKRTSGTVPARSAPVPSRASDQIGPTRTGPPPALSEAPAEPTAPGLEPPEGRAEISAPPVR